MVDVRWVILAVAVVAAALLIRRRPDWAVPAGVAIAFAAVLVTIMFLIP